MALVIDDAGREAFIHGLRWASLVALAVTLVGAAVAWRLLPGGTALSTPDAGQAATGSIAPAGSAATETEPAESRPLPTPTLEPAPQTNDEAVA